MSPNPPEHLDFHTGIPALDQVIGGVYPGDNIVWQVDSIDAYIPFVHAFCLNAQQENKALIYFRFGRHAHLLETLPEVEATVFELDPTQGFEHFITALFDVIEHYGLGACYVFDCLTDLAEDWYSDTMLANFFMLTCPYLYDLDTATYFALMRNHNASHAIKSIHDTAQVVIDLYQYNSEVYLHPLKVEHRHSPTMYMLHHWNRKNPQNYFFDPVTESATTSEILSRIDQPWLDYTVKRTDHWSQTFRSAHDLCAPAACSNIPPDERHRWRKRLLQMLISRNEDERFRLAENYFDMIDLLAIGKRLIGTGLIGGKSAGMLLAQAIIRQDAPDLYERLEVQDSFLIGSDVYYTFLVRNKCWWPRRKISQEATLGAGIEATQELIMEGEFTALIREQFVEMLNYYGQSPIIVRSSSLQEDDYGNSFSGKYVSVFLANQGTPDERLNDFMTAVKTIYASTLSLDALTYRRIRGLLDKDEQMALLVMRVSGNRYGHHYFPHVGGVGFSFNPYRWNPEIDPESGMLRVVFGLGTRAVDRTDDDYTRIVALNAPTLRLEHDFAEIHKHAQKKVDTIDLFDNEMHTRSFETLARELPQLPMALFTSIDIEAQRRAEEYQMTDFFAQVLTFDPLLQRQDVISDFRTLLAKLQAAYHYPVDIEFTVNFKTPQSYRINLLQCRPFQVKQNARIIAAPEALAPEQVVFRTHGPIIGNSLATRIDRVIYVIPSEYARLTTADRYALARLIGEITHLPGSDALCILLLGPGRWGTSTPFLGIPVRFSDINTVTVLGEVAEMHEGLIPDVSLGSHFFNDIVELDILYFALHPARQKDVFNRAAFTEGANLLPEILPTAAKWATTVVVKDYIAENLMLNMNTMTQNGILYQDKAPHQ